MAEPIMPAHEPHPEPDPTDRDLQIDQDVIIESAVSDPDEEAAAARMRERSADTSFRTPTAGRHLDSDALARDLEDEQPPRD